MGSLPSLYVKMPFNRSPERQGNLETVNLNRHQHVQTAPSQNSPEKLRIQPGRPHFLTGARMKRLGLGILATAIAGSISSLHAQETDLTGKISVELNAVQTYDTSCTLLTRYLNDDDIVR